MNKEQNNINENSSNAVSNNSSYKETIFSPRFGLILSTINSLFCVIAFCIFVGFYFSQLIHSDGSSSGWFLFVLPIFIGMCGFCFIPDFLCFLFARKNKNKKKKKYVILTIVLSILGCIIMNSELISELLIGLEILQLIYTILKIVVILFNIVMLIVYKNFE